MVIRLDGRRCIAVCAGVVALILAPLSAAADQAALDLGKKVFLELAEPSCSICHTLADAGAAGAVGPDLDEMKPTAEQIETAVTNGLGAMPAFEALTKEQIAAVALYVSTITK